MTTSKSAGRTTSGRSGGPNSASSKAGITARAARAGEKIRSGGQVAGKRAAEGVESFPVAALVGGLAIGAVLGALLPRTRQEEDLLGPLGGTINERAKNAVAAARDAGQAKLEELGLNSDAAGKQVGKLIDSMAQVAESVGSAAVGAVRP